MGLLDFFFGSSSSYSTANPKIQLKNETIEFCTTTATYTGDAVKFSSKAKPHGKGVAVLANGDIFSGTFEYGNPCEGKYIFENGSYCYIKYTSKYSAKYLAPYGWRKPNEEKKYNTSKLDYVGELKNGLPDGIGKAKIDRTKLFDLITYINYYEGGYKQGKFHGVGKYTFHDGTYDICVYDNGNMIHCLKKVDKVIEDDDCESDDYEEEKPDYISESFKNAEIQLIAEKMRNGDYEGARNALDRLDSDDEIGFHDGTGYMSRSADEWKDYIDENSN